jgi:hypothetical protein
MVRLPPMCSSVLAGTPGIGKKGVLTKTVALLGVSRVDTKSTPLLIPDLYVPMGQGFSGKAKLEEPLDHICANRALRWEDGLE